MRVIVTGATSFLGSHAVKSLIDQGYEVCALIRPNSAGRKNLVLDEEKDKLLEITECELSDLKQLVKTPNILGQKWAHEIGKADYWLHLGWDGSGSANRTLTDVQSMNTVYALDALEVAAVLGCKRFLFCGSQAEYGVRNTQMKETDVLHPLSEYGKAKAKVGELAKKRAEELRITYIHTRVFSVYGPGDHPWSLVESCIRTFKEGGTMELGACTQLWNYLYITDAIRALVTLLVGDAPAGVYNVAGEDTRPLRDYIEEIRSLCGGKGECLYGKRPPNAEGVTSLNPDITKLQEAIGFEQRVPFTEGIRGMIERENMGKCISCKASLAGTAILAFDNMPAAAQHMPDKEQVKNEKGIHLPLCQCKNCGLIQFDCEPVSYYRDVIRAGGYSTTMVELRRRQYSEFIDRYHLEGKKIVEAGCGRGEFLRVLREFPVEGYGIEHDKSLVEIAKADGLNVSYGFTETVDTKISGGPFDAFLSFNFLEHQPHPDVMLTCLYNNLTEDGVGLITVPSFEYITDHNTYYELIHDHLAYFTFDSLTYLLNQNGFVVESKEMINRDTLSVMVKKTKTPVKQVSLWKDFTPELTALGDSLTSIRNQMEDLSKKLERKRLAIWGASHQGFTLAATTCLGQKAEEIIDSAPFKHGKYAPASHLLIVSPEKALENPPDAILIAAPGYTDEIAGVIRERFPKSVQIFAIRSNQIEELN